MKCFKYSIPPPHYGYDKHSGLVESVLRVYSCREHSSALGSYDSTVRMALSFFTRVKLEVEILPRGSPPHEISSGITQEAYIELGYGKIPEIISQCLMLRAKNNEIPKLGARMCLNGAGPHHMRWKMPETIIERSERADGKERTWSKYMQSPRYKRLLKDDTFPLVVWYAYRRTGANEKLTLNTDPLLTQKLTELGKPFIDMEIQFMPVDKKPRKYRLNTKSWDELNLTKID